MDKLTRSAFGCKEDIELAKTAGTIDKFDILYLDTQEIGWIDKNGKTVISTARTQSPIPVNGISGIGMENEQVIPAGKSLDEITEIFVSALSDMSNINFIIEDTLEIPDVSFEAFDDMNGNVVMTFNGIEITDDSNGNVTILSDGLSVSDDGIGNVTISV